MMWEWIKEVGLTILSIMTLIFVIYLLFFKTCPCGAETVEFEVLVPVSPESEILVPITSYDENEFDLENFIDKSNETGLYPSWGWTGEYYITGVTHGPVSEKFDLGVTKSGLDLIYSSEDPVIPEPSSLALLSLGTLILMRRSR